MKFFEIFFQLGRWTNQADSTTLEELEATGHGLCGIQTTWFVNKCLENGILATNMSLPIPYPELPIEGNGHTVAAVNMEGTWVMIDCSNSMFFTIDGKLASWSQIVNYVVELKRLPPRVRVVKQIYSYPEEPTKQRPSWDCAVCGSDGILDRYYNVENISKCTQHIMLDTKSGKYVVYDTIADKALWTYES